MTQVDFYLSPDAHDQARYLLACRLTEKAYKMGLRIYLHTSSAEHAQQIDDLLWKFRDGSFIPHELCVNEMAQESPVMIGHDKDPTGEADVLINLTHEVPGFFSQFERVAELVSEDPEHKAQARERYKFYRDRGYELNTHQL